MQGQKNQVSLAQAVRHGGKTVEGNGNLGGINQNLKARWLSLQMVKKLLQGSEKVRIRSSAKYRVKRAEKKVG